MLRLLSLTLFAGPLFSQGLPVVAQSGYGLPGDTILATTGQFLNVSIFGIEKHLPEITLPTPDPRTGLPYVLEGISVEFVQGPLTVQLQPRALQQTPCPLSGECHPVTTVSLQIPEQYAADSRDQGKLVFKEDGTVAAEVKLQGVPDRVHIMNTCDRTGVFFSVAATLPSGPCRPIVTHAKGGLVTTNDPALPGETLVIWAYGLGALSRPLPVPNLGMLPDVPVPIQPFDLGVMYLRSSNGPYQRLITMPPAWAGGQPAGVYQVHMVVPEAPEDLLSFCPPTGNLLVRLSGPVSSDTASLCLQR